MEQESIYDWLWLLLVFGAGSRKIWKLLEQYETCLLYTSPSPRD